MYWEFPLHLFRKIVGQRRVGKPAIGFALCVVFLLSLLWIASAQAQVQGGWSEPYRLSSDAGKASEGYLVADQYGYVHSFWTELLHEDGRTIIQYARFDGATWSASNQIFVAENEIENVSPVVDQQGTLHIVWVASLDGSAHYSHAPAYSALSAQSWSPPLRIDLRAKRLQFRIDSRGVFHILYINQAEEPGVYYVRSEDQGATWSEPVWLDPDILPNHIPDSLNFELDDTGGLHVVWYYGTFLNNADPDWIRYAHSLDGGNTWSLPFMIDQVDEEENHYLASASPRMIVQGQTVHIIWAAGNLPYRYHRFSRDAGQTWSPSRRIFGELQGQAFDGLTLDGAGRVHFLGQIRYPMGIYHAYWDENQWSPPSLIYLIAQVDSEVGIGDRIHAHLLSPVVRAGNQLILTFGDGPAEPNRRLFAMYRTLDDVAPLASLPTPVLTATPLPLSSPTPLLPTPLSTATPKVVPFDITEEPSGFTLRPDLGLQLVLVPTLFLLVGIVVIRMVFARRR